LRKAVCSAARPSVSLIGAPENIAARRDATPRAAAISSSAARAGSVMLVLE